MKVLCIFGLQCESLQNSVTVAALLLPMAQESCIMATRLWHEMEIFEKGSPKDQSRKLKYIVQTIMFEVKLLKDTRRNDIYEK